MDKCPKCGAGEDASESSFSCGTRRGVNGAAKVSNQCLRRQLAQSDEKRAELKIEHDLLFAQLAAANAKLQERDRQLHEYKHAVMNAKSAIEEDQRDLGYAREAIVEYRKELDLYNREYVRAREAWKRVHVLAREAEWTIIDTYFATGEKEG